MMSTQFQQNLTPSPFFTCIHISH